MKTNLLLTSLTIAITASFLSVADAQVPSQTATSTSTPRVDNREVKQEARIEQGKASGALNSKEAARLEKGQDNVVAAEEKAKADGKVTKKERARLAHKQNKQSKRIAVQKNDAQVKPAPAN